ncbi:MAG: FAD:protein FMN transferase [Lawsonibacter sp.]|jgi:thiamine biosynthesis lipoprotein
MPGRKFSRTVFLLVSFALILSLSSCNREPSKAETQIFAMDTVMTLTLYGPDRQTDLSSALDELVNTIYTLQNLLSATDPNSELYALNHAGGQSVALSLETTDLLSQAIDLCRLTDGALDLTAYPAVQAWGFPSGEYRVPGEEELAQLASKIDYTQLQVDTEKCSAQLPQGMEADAGAVAKGYAGDLLAQQLAQKNISSALLDLGQSTIQAVGNKPDGSPWRIGVQDPAGDSYLGVIELSGQAMGTSGGYQRFFEKDGVRYWHILNPNTAAPARSGVSSVTVVGPSALVCDGLSTALFVLGVEDGLAFWRNHPELNTEVLFVLEDGSLVLTPGLNDQFTLSDSEKGREVTVAS